MAGDRYGTGDDGSRRGAGLGRPGGALMAVKADDPAYLAAHEAEDAAGLYTLREGQEELDLLLGVVMDASLPVETRIKAADKLAPFRHAKRSDPGVTITFDMAGFLAQLRAERDRMLSAPSDAPQAAQPPE